jgi:hypothetical protein
VRVSDLARGVLQMVHVAISIGSRIIVASGYGSFRPRIKRKRACMVCFILLCLVKTLCTRRMNGDELGGRCFDKILAIVTSLRHLLGWVLSIFSAERTSSLKISPSVSNCWLCTPSDLVVD